MFSLPPSHHLVARCPPACRAVGTVLALEEHVQRLFLLVLASDLPPGLGEADVINGLALLSVLINASYGGWLTDAHTAVKPVASQDIRGEHSQQASTSP